MPVGNTRPEAIIVRAPDGSTRETVPMKGAGIILLISAKVGDHGKGARLRIDPDHAVGQRSDAVGATCARQNRVHRVTEESKCVFNTSCNHSFAS